MRRPILKLPQAHKGMVSGLTFTSHKNDMHRQLLSCGSLDMTIKMWKVSKALTGHLSRTAIDMEEGEALDEYGRNAFADVGGKGRLDGMMRIKRGWIWISMTRRAGSWRPKVVD